MKNIREEQINKIEDYVFKFAKRSKKLLRLALRDYRTLKNDYISLTQNEFKQLYPLCEYNIYEIDYAISLCNYHLRHYENDFCNIELI